MDFPTPKPKNHFSDRSPNLLTNCDLPPPLQLFSPFFFDDDNHGVLRALRLSQSRAREAEKRVELATAKSAQLASMLLDESMRLSVHRRWAMMLEFEVAALRKRLSQADDDDEDDGPVEIARWLALAVCVGIAGVGFAIGRCFF
ncbi:uncharacterized protein LOC110030772 [Phalaenopsis equestris]|uniref:uncharacterized protein LOC110030772 n=1 Tax=Phalaenopsis equestris TaxID=78828 RepID=UPI0009E36CBC|nr:uncharacterized protein LOC110030772 [Phalaenopsis equestris]